MDAQGYITINSVGEGGNLEITLSPYAALDYIKTLKPFPVPATMKKAKMGTKESIVLMALHKIKYEQTNNINSLFDETLTLQAEDDDIICRCSQIENFYDYNNLKIDLSHPHILWVWPNTQGEMKMWEEKITEIDNEEK
ncbi:MAG: hypothetical protein M0T74_11965 [Desulfitobacterium hafniense]|nr:hypothetical protein [Desulfitobacterium hafniense]